MESREDGHASGWVIPSEAEAFVAAVAFLGTVRFSSVATAILGEGNDADDDDEDFCTSAPDPAFCNNRNPTSIQKINNPVMPHTINR
mmetsp:Transcript_12147/g.28828  ORF Transcript_12147/g.28828 Transcript_12147/m.28828 type:complete len:87 (+) Transcript_12147:524-784(+)